MYVEKSRLGTQRRYPTVLEPHVPVPKCWLLKGSQRFRDDIYTSNLVLSLISSRYSFIIHIINITDLAFSVSSIEDSFISYTTYFRIIGLYPHPTSPNIKMAPIIQSLVMLLLPISSIWSMPTAAFPLLNGSNIATNVSTLNTTMEAYKEHISELSLCNSYRSGERLIHYLDRKRTSTAPE